MDSSVCCRQCTKNFALSCISQFLRQVPAVLPQSPVTLESTSSRSLYPVAEGQPQITRSIPAASTMRTLFCTTPGCLAYCSSVTRTTTAVIASVKCAKPLVAAYCVSFCVSYTQTNHNVSRIHSRWHRAPGGAVLFYSC
jgi:hypothetical protein